MFDPATNRHFFYTELAKLIGAGFGIREAADLLLDSKLPAKQAALLQRLKAGLASGQSIAQSFAADPNVTDLEKSIIDAGERGGRLAPAFDHLADYFGMVSAARRQLIKGSIYPLVLLHIGVIFGIVPTALINGQSFASTIPQILLNLAILYAVAFGLFLAIRWIMKRATDHAAFDSALNRIPFIGKARRNMALARFAKVYHICLLAGLSIKETVHTSIAAAHSGTLSRDGKALEKQAGDGGPIGPVFVISKGFPKAFSSSYLTAEEAGTLDKDLERWVAYFSNEAADSVKNLSAVLPKLFYFLIVLFVGWKIVNFYFNYFQVLDSIGN
ncbi:type II secretion system F family protein [Luteolibacter pohnpeiensis]|uniref:Type II secretion system F family protein n=1 Tax=Luteolibacter pohnpeiensis TaxID=454153 RepID=A0A934S696_9BACT|nr:type II secretion system F family protein [Luteolibacter pohnpeiensis]MBK1881551.1 type II secretion system F family protein [Luteolibacter pohnpeiensis]